MVLGDPGAGEVYGFVARRGDEAVACLRNPSDRPQPLDAGWADLFGFEPTSLLARYGRLAEVLAPFDVLLVEATPRGVPRSRAPNPHRSGTRSVSGDGDVGRLDRRQRRRPPAHPHPGHGGKGGDQAERPAQGHADPWPHVSEIQPSSGPPIGVLPRKSRP